MFYAFLIHIQEKQRITNLIITVMNDCLNKKEVCMIGAGYIPFLTIDNVSTIDLFRSG